MDTTAVDRERLLRLLATATFVIFFQAYMVAPIIPQLGIYFGASDEVAGSVVPAYLIPYGIATLVYGVIADRVGIRLVMLFSLSMFILLSLLTLTAQSIDSLIIWRFLTGLGASGVVPMALVLVGMQFPYEMRGRPLGWLFGAMAGGMAFGSSIGAFLEPFIGWRGLFLIVGASGAVVLALLLRSGKSLVMSKPLASMSLVNLVTAYNMLLTTSRGARTYGYVFVNSIFHSGVFTWLGVYFEQRYHLGAVGVGLALLGYGVPGFLFGPFIGRMADRYGRGRILPIGLLISALAAASLVWNFPLIIAAFAVMFLSLGYDMTQPLLGGIVTTLGGQRPGQAMGLNVFMLFVGFGVGSLLFGRVLTMGFEQALTLFAIVEGVLTLASLKLFHSERPKAVIGLP
jgi:predicted MFS family arabinose efflux permease